VRSSARAVGGGLREPRTGGRKGVLQWLGWLCLSKSKVEGRKIKQIEREVVVHCSEKLKIN